MRGVGAGRAVSRTKKVKLTPEWMSFLMSAELYVSVADFLACESCVHWALMMPDDKRSLGVCKLNPPLPSNPLSEQVLKKATRPWTWGDDYCGRHSKAKP